MTKITGYPGETIEHFACRLIETTLGNNETIHGEFNNIKLVCSFPDTVREIVDRYNRAFGGNDDAI